jgi:ankyrin repeat protein
MRTNWESKSKDQRNLLAKSRSGKKHSAVGVFAVVAFCLGSMGCAGTHGNKDISLIRAAERGATEEMFQLIRDGANVNAIDKEGWTPYLAASTKGHLDAMKMLRAMGARTEAPEMHLVQRDREFLLHQ